MTTTNAPTKTISARALAGLPRSSPRRRGPTVSIRLLVSADGGTGRLVAERARGRGHDVREPDDPGAVAGAGAIVLIPRRGDGRRHAHQAVVALAAAASPAAHLLLVSSFAVGYGREHPLNRVVGATDGRRDAERALRASGLAWTIVRPTWLTDDPAGAHAITLTQDPRPDGMIARADLATVLLAAVEQPDARHRTFALYNEPGRPPSSWARSFAALAPDPEARAA